MLGCRHTRLPKGPEGTKMAPTNIEEEGISEVSGSFGSCSQNSRFNCVKKVPNATEPLNLISSGDSIAASMLDWIASMSP